MACTATGTDAGLRAKGGLPPGHASGATCAHRCRDGNATQLTQLELVAGAGFEPATSWL
jgi:hypothetical protein